MAKYPYQAVLSSKSFLLLFLLLLTVLANDFVSRVLVKSEAGDNGAVFGTVEAHSLPAPVVPIERALQAWPVIAEESETAGARKVESAASVKTKDGVYQLMAVYSNSNDAQSWYANIRYTDLTGKVTQKLLREDDKIGLFTLKKIGIGSVSLDDTNQSFTLFLFELNKHSEEKPR